MSDKEEIRGEVRNIFDKIFKTPYIMTEDEEGEGFVQTTCPYKACDGRGTLTIYVNGYRKAKNCRCYEDEIVRRKLKNSNLDDSLWNQKLNLSNLEGVILHPIQNPPERQLQLTKQGKPKAVQEPETPEEHVYRAYQHIQMPNGLEAFIHTYVRKTLEYINESPIQQVKNLMLLGDTGRGKTFTASMIGKEYLLNQKKAYFTTMRTLVADVMKKEKDIESIVSDVDLLIIDELGYEYHTDSGWAVTQIKEFLRTRYNKKLPVVCTTNKYPIEIENLYDKSLMSLFHGTYFMVYVDNKQDGDYRYQIADNSLSDFGLELPQGQQGGNNND
ncbi:ATP-binding protein [Bacillus thuringiensis]|uniref:ATP-binding protein n=1 Tax=Bacillus thuringiensis TaxID=1428 RepID=UPI0021D6888D|nr:ATP-binding protein [Bacillus thuringiensis]MCU7666944.1 ATP-binding protein [Bacillus thuringiensis]